MLGMFCSAWRAVFLVCCVQRSAQQSVWGIRAIRHSRIHVFHVSAAAITATFIRQHLLVRGSRHNHLGGRIRSPHRLHVCAIADIHTPIISIKMRICVCERIGCFVGDVCVCVFMCRCCVRERKPRRSHTMSQLAGSAFLAHVRSTRNVDKRHN